MTTTALCEIICLPPTENCLAVLEYTIDNAPLTSPQAALIWKRIAGVAAFLDYGAQPFRSAHAAVAERAGR